MAVLILAVTPSIAPGANEPECNVVGTYRMDGKTVRFGRQRIEAARIVPGMIQIVGQAVFWSGDLASREGRRGLRYTSSIDADEHDVFVARFRAPRCQRLVGTITRRKDGKRRRFRALRSRCGDGHVEPLEGEECETDADCPVGECSAECTCLGRGGHPDTTFGNGGIVRTPVPGLPTECPVRQQPCVEAGVRQVVIQPDGRILALGFGPRPSHLLLRQRVLFRYLADGTLDPGFRGGGTLGERMQLLADHRILLAGGVGDGAPGLGHVLIRLLSDGFGDPDFTVDVPRGGVDVDDLAVSTEGGILTLAAGDVVHWDTNGAFVGPIDLPAGWIGVTLDETGRILALTDGTELRLRRFTSAGAPDSTFAGGESICIARTDEQPPLSLHGVSTLPSGELFLSVYPVAGELAVVRVPGDGGTGTECPAAPVSFTSGPLPVATQGDGKFLAVGSSGLVRLLPDGRVDPDFGRLGRVDTEGIPATVALDTAGRIVVGTITTTQELVLQRFLP